MTQLNSTNNTGSGQSNLVYLLAGGAIGAAAALLFAPKAGADLRSDIVDVTKKGYDGAVDLTGRVKEQTTNLYQTLREKTNGLVDGAADKLSATEGSIDDAIVSNTNKVKDAVLSLADNDQSRSQPSSTTPGSVRKSSNIV